MADLIFWISLFGSLGFGLVVGWVTYGTLRRAQRGNLSDIATVIGAVAGAAITALFPKESGAFGAYCIGLTIGFFIYPHFATDPKSPDWLGPRPNMGGDNVVLPKPPGT